jgi:hypothetical protein
MTDSKAITNWQGEFGSVTRKIRDILGLFGLICLPFIGPMIGHSLDAPPSSLSPIFAGMAHEQLRQAKKKYDANPKDLDLAWRLGKAYFFVAEFTTDKAVHAELAEHGIAVCGRALAANPDSPEVAYYYALNQGQSARTKLLGALSLVRQMENNLLNVAQAKPLFDFAGADRCLGLLYRDAPGWPISVGSNKKAKSHLLTSFALVPDHPENILVLLETWIKWKDYRQLKDDLPAGKAVLAKARKKLSGQEWAPFWDDWDRRWKVIQGRAEKMLRNR